VLFHGVFVRGGARLSVRESYQITMASLAATRIFAAGGAGGIALTAWAMRRAGMDRRAVADRTITFLVLTYAVYMAAIVVVGVGLRIGLFPGPAPFGMTVVPAVFAAVSIVLTLLLSLTPTDLQRRMDAFACRGGRLANFVRRAASLPAAMSAGVRLAIHQIRERDPAVVGAIAYWFFNVAVLWAAFRAFGQSPSWAVILMAYLVGMLGNLLPLPGGVGGVDGGMIGALIAFGVSSGLSVVVVLTYRAFAFWLPTIPGAIAFFQLRRTVARWREERDRDRAGAAAAAARV
ncbi:MAG: putative heme transporter, partial [Solirubrobacteraceae bacterium]|nr:putative heme transporter [Solirubrobacteraceae bacterium]